MRIRSLVTITLLLCAAPVFAQTPEATPAGVEEPPPATGFVEIFGNWGVNFGVTDFLPDGAPSSREYPFASGFGGGAAVGIYVLPWLSILVDWRYAGTGTIHGHLNGALTDVHGTLKYQAITAGVRMEHRWGPGAAYAEFTGGALLPFHTTLTFDYDPALALAGITGSGEMKERFGFARGARAEMGYHWDVRSRMYLGAGLQIGTFQATNNGRDTELTNFVTDFTVVPPVAVTTTIHHSKHVLGPTPTTYSVQDIRLNISLGYRF
jgi:hypothetical protein